MMNLADKVVLVTGAARGIGRALVRAFLREGSHVVATDLSWIFLSPSNDDRSYAALLEGNPSVLQAEMDITIGSHLQRVFRETIERFATMDVIINNAGMRARDLYPDTGGAIALIETQLSDWHRMFGTHVFGTMEVIKTFIPPMLSKRRGSIINVGTAGLLSNVAKGLGGPYLPAKAAMHNMTLYLADDLRDSNISANVLCPGYTHTTGTTAQRALSMTALRPESVVPSALFLSRQDAGGVTREVIDVMKWNEANGFGGTASWAYVEEA
jgi:NAD(P)-dependent dehydrogenase (short-subunit alcohol dehydrogenase family)